jgi:hypothetical protein
VRNISDICQVDHSPRIIPIADQEITSARNENLFGNIWGTVSQIAFSEKAAPFQTSKRGGLVDDQFLEFG